MQSNPSSLLLNGKATTEPAGNAMRCDAIGGSTARCGQGFDRDDGFSYILREEELWSHALMDDDLS